MTLDQGTATAIAATLAALVSLATLIATLVASGKAEMRAAHREILAPYLEHLSDDLYTVLAGVTIMRKRADKQKDVAAWQHLAKDAGMRIDATRRKIRYFLPGLDEGFRELALASDHIATLIPIDGDWAADMLDAYSTLAKRTNGAIRASYRSGTPPLPWRRWGVGRAARKVASEWDQRPRQNAAAPME